MSSILDDSDNVVLSDNSDNVVSHSATFNVNPPTCPRSGHGLLIDTGAIVNLHSDFWRRRFQGCLATNGLKAYMKDNIASFSGIGGKASISQKMYKLPINVKGIKGDFVSQELDKSQIPAILGLNGIEKNEMMIIPHDEHVIIPNGGKVKISITKEVKLIKCMRTPSGHLLLPCDTFDEKDERNSSITLFENQLIPCLEADEPMQDGI